MKQYKAATATATLLTMEKVHLVFIPSPLMGHMGQLVEFAYLLLNRFTHISISVLITKLPNDPITNAYADSLSSTATTTLHFHYLPQINPSPHWIFVTPADLADLILEENKPHVRHIVHQLINDRHHRVAGLVVDMFCTTMIDVGTEFGVGTYVFYTSSAAFLGLILHLQTLQDEHGVDVSELKDFPGNLVIPSYESPVPANNLPKRMLEKHWWSVRFLRYTRQYRQAKGIIVNTFTELEPHALTSYDSQTPRVYPVGPLLKSAPPVNSSNDHIMQWLDAQPESSVVFLCFGSRGCFSKKQVSEIAVGLEHSGCRFLWSLRRPSADGLAKGFPEEYEDPTVVLPDGFLKRTDGIGKVIGWAPQMAVLSHVAIAGFVSHCGWNSTLESLWSGVPIATWPLYAEQQMNAHQLVKEIGLSVEISLDYNQLDANQSVVKAETIENGIRKLMDGDGVLTRKVTEMREKSRKATEKGGSSYKWLECLVDDMMET